MRGAERGGGLREGEGKGLREGEGGLSLREGGGGGAERG